LDRTEPELVAFAPLRPIPDDLEVGGRAVRPAHPCAPGRMAGCM